MSTIFIFISFQGSVPHIGGPLGIVTTLREHYYLREGEVNPVLFQF